MTLKSTVGFGNYSYFTVSRLLELNKIRVLVGYYFLYDKISYIDEVLTLLGITEEYRIDKPGKNNFLYEKFIKENDLQVRDFKKDKRLIGMDNMAKYYGVISRGVRGKGGFGSKPDQDKHQMRH